MSILVTGGAGYVGGACLRYLLSQGERAIAYDNLTLGHEKSLSEDCLTKGDILDTVKLTNTLADLKTETVMHFAASAYVGESMLEPLTFYKNNLAGTVSVLQAMRDAGVRKILFSSTCSTYGTYGDKPLHEGLVQNPENPYARTKLAVEQLIRESADAYGMGYAILRYFNAAGADLDGENGEDHDPETHLIPLVLQAALGQNNKLKVFGMDYPTPDGTCIRDYIHVQDLADAHYKAVQNLDENSRMIFNLGTGHGHSVLQVVNQCMEITGVDIDYTVAERRPGDPAALVANCDKIKTALDWSAQYDLEDIIKSAWQWHRRYPRGYRSR